MPHMTQTPMIGLVAIGLLLMLSFVVPTDNGSKRFIASQDEIAFTQART
jgi:hypothetical protein